MASPYAVIPAHVAAGYGVEFDDLDAAMEAAKCKSIRDGVRRLVVRVHTEVVREPTCRAAVRRVRRCANGR